ncbi:MAG: hypothetical protein LBM01_02910 [Christensenellaceae bacterium]|jgi:hypothetical protein|nr:hypothetical protein [Christensenellaceae bacterium]
MKLKSLIPTVVTTAALTLATGAPMSSCSTRPSRADSHSDAVQKEIVISDSYKDKGAIWDNETYANKTTDPTRQKGALYNWLKDFYMREFVNGVSFNINGKRWREDKAEILREDADMQRAKTEPLSSAEERRSARFVRGFAAAYASDEVANQMPFNAKYIEDIVGLLNVRFATITLNELSSIGLGGVVIDRRLHNDAVDVVIKALLDGHEELTDEGCAEAFAEVALHTLGDACLGLGSSTTGLWFNQFGSYINNREQGERDPGNEEFLLFVLSKVENKAEFWAAATTSNREFCKYLDSWMINNPKAIKEFQQRHSNSWDVLLYADGFEHEDFVQGAPYTIDHKLEEIKEALLGKINPKQQSNEELAPSL